MGYRRNTRRVRGAGGNGRSGGAPTVGITSVTPDIGFRLLNGTTAPYLRTVTGFGFEVGDSVRVDGVDSTDVTVVNPTTITMNVGTLASAGDKDVQIVRAGNPIGFPLSGGYTVEIAEVWYRGDIGNGASWTDLGDFGQHAVQGTAGFQPTLSASTINGLPGLVCDGVDDFLLAPIAFNSATHCTYVVQRADGATVNHGIRGIIGVGQTGDSNNAQSCILFRNNTNTITEASNGNLSNAAGPVNGSAGLIESVFNGTVQTTRCNGTTGASVAKTTTMNVDRLYIGCRFVASAPTIFYPGTFCEMLVFAQLPSASTRTKIRTYLANRYNQANFI